MNPEFQRNLWLETGPRRLAWTAVVLAAVYGAAMLVGGSDVIRALGLAGLIVFLVAGLMWAPRIAGRAVAEEVMQRTWDFQRLSALTPWAMTWGKLFGAASLAWIAALTGLVLAVLAALLTGEAAKIASMAVAGLGAAVLLQAGSMALALVAVRRARIEGRVAGFRFTLGGLIGLAVVASSIAKIMPARGVGGPIDWLTGGFDNAAWWGVPIPGGWFLALSLAAFAAWALVAAWRLMRLELQMENFPWAWPLFALFAGVWAAGVPAGAPASVRFAVAGMVFAACAYAAAFAEPADRVRLRQFVEALTGSRNLMRAAHSVPAMIAPVTMAALAAIGVALCPDVGAGRFPAGLIALAALAFLLRDLGVVTYFRFGPRPGRGDFGAVLGLFLAYFVGGIVGRQLGGDVGMALFTPSLTQPAIAAVAGAVQAVLIWSLAWSRIRAPERSET